MNDVRLFSSLLEISNHRDIPGAPKKYLRFDSKKGQFFSGVMSRIDRVKRFFGFSDFSAPLVARAIIDQLKMEEGVSLEETIKAQKIVNKIFYLAKKKPVDLFKGKNGDWMGSLPDAVKRKRLHKLVLLGTHDSCAYVVNYLNPIPTQNKLHRVLGILAKRIGSIGSFLSGWTRTQYFTIQEQLEMGVRSFDFRISYHSKDGQIYLTHTYNCTPLKDALDQLEDFLKTHPGEVIIIHSKSDWEHREGMKAIQSQQYIDMVNEHLGNFLCPPVKSLDESMRLDLMVQEGRRVVFSYEGAGDTNCTFSWDTNLFNSTWNNTSDIKKKKAGLDKTIDSYKRKQETVNALLFTLTPQTKDIVHGIFRPKSNLERLNQPIQDLIPDYLDKLENVTEIVADFITPDIAALVIQQNFK